MQKQIFILLLLSLHSCRLAAQGELMKDNPLPKRLPTEMEGILQASPLPAAATIRQKMPEKMVSSYDPYVMDYEHYNAFRLSNVSTLSTFSTYNAYPTMGTLVQVGADYTYRPNERWELTGGMYTAKYTMPSRMHGAQFDIGLTASAAYRINDFLRIRFIGQYSGFGRENSFNGYMNPSYPQSYYGVIMEMKVNDYLQIHGGMGRTYNPTKMKWETMPILYPVIDIRKKKKK